jgi:glycosyltransferase involved in cell wall biosynthesis
MRITCLIKSLECGGAERQIGTLATLLKQAGHAVSFLTYHPADFYLPMVRQAGIAYRCIERPSPMGRLFALRHALRNGSQDVVLAFMDRSCVYAEFAALPSRPWGLVVSERSAVPKRYRGPVSWLRPLHCLADYITTNSHSNRFLIERAVPRVVGRVATIYNALDLDKFCPGSGQLSGTDRKLRLVVVARHIRAKNALHLVEALAIVRSRSPHWDVSVDWYGGDPFGGQTFSEPTPYQATVALIRVRGLENSFRLHSSCKDIVAVYRGADAVVLPSLYEGLPNAVCEAMACGRPVLMSKVGDAGNLVVEGQNGFLFDASLPGEIVRAIEQLGELRTREREALGAQGRAKAEKLFDPLRVSEMYLELLHAAAQRKQIPVRHWVPEIPETAQAFLNHEVA